MFKTLYEEFTNTLAMKIRFKKTVFFFVVLLVFILGFLTWHNHTNLIEVFQTFKINSSSLDRKLLIATQNSPFKDSVAALVSNRYQSVPIIVEVVDIKALATKDATNYDAILILHRWEAGAPPERVQSFINKNLRIKNKVVILTTSWNGLEKMRNVDAITGASTLEDVPIFTNKITKRLDRLLKYKN